MKKRILMLLVMMVFGQFLTEASILVNYTGSVVDSAGVAVPNGNQVRIGYFNASFDVVTAAQTGDWAGTLNNWHQFSFTTTAVGGLPPHAGVFAESPSKDGTGFFGQPIYLWAFKTTTDQPPTSWSDVMEYGVFVNPSNPDSNWTFPADLGDTSVASDNLGVLAYQGHGDILGGSLQLAGITAVPASSKPTVQTLAATPIGTGSATLKARITVTGGFSILERRFSWGTTAACSDGWTPAVSVDGNDFTYNLNGLVPGTVYYFQAWAINSVDWGKSIPASFKFFSQRAPTIGDRVQADGLVWVRQTAGGTHIGNQASGTQGTVIGGPAYAQADGAGSVLTWYNIDWPSAPDGWVGEVGLILVAQPPPDLAVENVRFTPASVNPGGSLAVTFRVRNLSGRTSSASIARLRLSSDATLTESDPGLVPLDVAVPSLLAGTMFEYSGNFIVPGSLSPGNFILVVRADPQNLLGQSNIGNDTGISPTPLTVVGTGRAVLELTPTSRTVADAPGTTSFVVRNAGGGSLSWSAAIAPNAATWLHFVSASSGVAGLSGSTVIVNIDRNPSTGSRTGIITVSAPGASPASQQVQVTQLGASPPPAAVTYFQISNIPSSVVVNAPFAVTITAMNGNIQPAQVQSAFNGRVLLTLDSGGQVNLQYVDLRNGLFSGELRMNSSVLTTKLVATDAAGSGAEGRSNPFEVASLGSQLLHVTVKVQMQDGTPVSEATVTLELPGIVPLTQKGSDSRGLADFPVPRGSIFIITAEKAPFSKVWDYIRLEQASVTKTVVLRRGKPPVVLVPGIMGSGSLSMGLPVLPAQSPARQEDLRICNPWDYLGWKILKDSLQSQYEIFEAPWDWRVPAVSSANLAGRLYLLPVLAKAKQATGYDKVDVVAHSMGGLVTRAYIESTRYAGDIGRFAMVGTPNEGAANAYYLWFGGDTRDDLIYSEVASANYLVMTLRPWGLATQREKTLFFREKIPALADLLPVYPASLFYDEQTQIGYPGYWENALYQLNASPTFGQNYAKAPAVDKVYAKVFFSSGEQTIRQIRLNRDRSGGVVYPDGKPEKEPIKDAGDGTVWWESATMHRQGQPLPFPSVNLPQGSHVQLVKLCANQILDFLNEGRDFQAVARVQFTAEPVVSSANRLVLAVNGRGQPWMLDPGLAGAGISPVTGAFSNGWARGQIEVGAEGSSFELDDPVAGSYLGNLTAPPGATLSLQAQFFRGNELQATNLNWIGGSNDITFRVQLAPTETNALTLAPAVPSPQNLWSFPSEGNCTLTWKPLADTNVVAYRVYARREDESLFAPLTTTTNILCNTGHAWISSLAGTNWFYAVVAIAAGGAESPYTDTVMNSAPTLARFTADLQSGTPPLSVTFTSQSLGGVTNWAWDFDSDGTIDSTEQNPSTIFTEEGSYTVTLTVFGPDGVDTLVAVGFISVSKPVLSARRFLPNHTMELGLSAQIGRNFEIQATTDFLDWTILTNLLTTNVTTIFTDPSATNYDQRFYRGVIP